MIVVVNTIQVKPGYDAVMRERFSSPKSVHTFAGFIQLELHQTQNLEDYEEYQVRTTWTDRAAFEAWTQSEAFRQAHAKRKESGGSDFVIGNKITFHEILVSHLPAASETS